MREMTEQKMIVFRMLGRARSAIERVRFGGRIGTTQYEKCLLRNPRLNKGTAFTEAARRAFLGFN
jgi:hypothetical protein